MVIELAITAARKFTYITSQIGHDLNSIYDIGTKNTDSLKQY